MPVTNMSSDVKQVVANSLSVCALKNDGSVWCWGYNGYGQLGNGTTNGYDTPQRVLDLDEVDELAAGGYFACAKKKDGSLWCWGENAEGHLGDGSTTLRSRPVGVVSLEKGVVQVATGWDHACAVKDDSTLWCWGYNAYGQLGVGNRINSSIPIQVTALENHVVQVECGDQFTCALKDDGTLWCWGYNSYGQLGDGSESSKDMPVQVNVPVEKIVALSPGGNHTCVLAQDGVVWCWGINTYGQLGNGSYGPNQKTPQAIHSLGTDNVEITAGEYHTCVRKRDYSVYCWGFNRFGQIGNGTVRHPHLLPVRVRDLPGPAREVVVSYNFSCALLEDNTIWCWGYNSDGQLGNGTTNIAWGPCQSLLLGSDNVQIALGAYFACVLKENGSVFCLGDNEWGQLGNGTTSSNSLVPVQVSGLGPADAIKAGSYHACALLGDKSVWCWGRNSDGQLGDGTQVSSSVPVQVTGLGQEVRQLAVRGNRGCSIKLDGTLWCWGDGSDGALGVGDELDHYLPVQVVNLGNETQEIWTGYRTTCARKTDNSWWCWGDNSTGQFGDGVTTNRSSPKNIVNLATTITLLSIGSEHACALEGNGSLWCWGGNSFGQLGIGTVFGPITTPQQVSSFPSSAKGVSTWSAHTCALAANGDVYCWGWNGYGQIGLGIPPMELLPDMVKGLCD
ncbi:MAG: RCC1 repeat-containing protein [candidate division WOR-3 bacterium]